MNGWVSGRNQWNYYRDGRNAARINGDFTASGKPRFKVLLMGAGYTFIGTESTLKDAKTLAVKSDRGKA